MEVFTPWIDVTHGVLDQIRFILDQPEKVVAQLFVMCGYGDEDNANNVDERSYVHDYYDKDINIA